ATFNQTETILFSSASLSRATNDAIMTTGTVRSLSIGMIEPTQSARDIMAIDRRTHLNRLKLGELIRHLARSEQDMEERLAAREKQVGAEDSPDPVRKRLFFLLLKHRGQRRAAEEALANANERR